MATSQRLVPMNEDDDPTTQYIITKIAKSADYHAYLLSKYCSRFITYPLHRFTISASIETERISYKNIFKGFMFYTSYQGVKLLYDYMFYGGPYGLLNSITQSIVSNGLTILTMRTIRNTQLPTLQTPIFWYIQGIAPLLCIHASVYVGVHLFYLDSLPNYLDLFICRILSYPFRKIYFARTSVHSEATTMTQFFWEEINSLKTLNNFVSWRAWVGFPFDVLEAAVTDYIRVKIQADLTIRLRWIILRIMFFFAPKGNSDV